MTHEFVTAPEHVVACDLDSATVLVNYSTGAMLSLIGPAAEWWSVLAVTGGGQPPSALDLGSARLLISRLLTAGFLIPTATACPWPAPRPGRTWEPSWGVQETRAGRARVPEVPRRSLASAAIALGIALLAEHCGQRNLAMARLIGLVHKAMTRATRPATGGEALCAVHAVRRAGAFLPGRLACLEESVAVVLMLAASCLRVTWCHGVAGDPVRLHAWVQTSDGQPVAEPPSTLRYTTLLTIPASPQGDDAHDH